MSIENRCINWNIIEGILASFLFLIACYIYVCSRSGSVVYDWLCTNTDDLIFHLIKESKNTFPLWIANNVVDGLWLLSCFLFIDLIWGRNNIKWWFVFGMFAFAVCLEILQYVKMCFGTGDVWDIISYILALTIYFGKTKIKKI